MFDVNGKALLGSQGGGLWLLPFGKMALSLPTMTGERVSVSDDSILPSRCLWQENQGGYFCSSPSRTGLFISKIV